MSIKIFTKIVILIVGLFYAHAMNPAITHEDLKRRDAIPENENVWTDINHRASIACKSHNSELIKYCFWRKDSSKNLEVSPHEGQIIPGYIYYGDGFDKGVCGITIEKVKEEDLGSWMCDLITENETLLGEVVLTRWEIPPLSLKPEILNKEELRKLQDLQLGADTPRASQNKRNITCCIEPLGKPPPHVHFQIDSKIITKTGLITFNDENKHNCIVWTDPVFTYLDNGRILRCVMDHVSFQKNISDIYDSVQLNVEFSPNLENLNEDTQIIIGNLEGGFDISVNVRANPFPHLNLILESKDGQTSLEVTDTETAIKSTLRTSFTNISDYQVRVMLRLLDVKKLHDGDKITFYASNSLGKENITFTFAAEEFRNNNTLYVTLFILISMFLLALIFIVIAWIVGKRRGRASYSPRKSTEDVTVRHVAKRVSSGAYKTADEITPVISSDAEGSRDTIN